MCTSNENTMKQIKTRHHCVIYGSGDDISWCYHHLLVSSILYRCITLLTCLWDILVDPMRRMLSSYLLFYSQCYRTVCGRSKTLLVFTFMFLITTSTAQTSPAKFRTQPSNVCGSIDVRNNISNFNKLKDCEVIEGNLQILLISANNNINNNSNNKTSYAEQINSISFPKLREITGFLLLFHVDELRSLGNLFPNLAVIRGNQVFMNYALVVFEMTHLQDIGLHSLTDVIRGSVRIEKNPLLCFVDTINWSIIARSGDNGHYFADNKEKHECQKCPKDKDCPKSATGEYNCWNQKHCQRVCPARCNGGSCSPSGECCHESCLGGCSGSTSRDCYVCRNVTLNKDCVQSCVNNTYKYLNRRCVTELECLHMVRPLERDDITVKRPFKPFQGICDLTCPTNYAEKERRMYGETFFTCEACKGTCRKECDGANIDSIASAQNFKGCTHIKGSLEIQIRGGGNVVKEIEDSLSSIEEISGYLKIVRSFPLVSLKFLKHLKVIRGEKLENNVSALYVLDNQNLQELWDWSNGGKLTILRGHLFFHFNPKLCYSKIEKLRQIANLPDFNEMEVSKHSNGDKVPCEVKLLETRVEKNTPYNVLIKWRQFEYDDPRSLLGYVVYSIKAPQGTNVTIYDDRDACGGDGWRVDDVEKPEENNHDEMVHVLTHLEPHTRYAYFVKTYTVATENLGAQSEIGYFVTKPATPTEPVNVVALSNSSSEVVIRWELPKETNGNLTHYIISGSFEKDTSFGDRDFCNDPLNVLSTETKKAVQPTPSSELPKPTDCECSTQKELEDKPKIIDKDEDRLIQIMFEDTLQNHVYRKRPISTRSKREVFQSFKKRWTNHVNMSTEGTNNNVTEKEIKINGTYHKFYREVNTTSVVIRDLHHFARYAITVRACRQPIPDDEFDACSTNKLVYVRTKKNETADNIPELIVSKPIINNTLGEVTLRWKDPPKPNGMIVSYTIQHHREDVGNNFCISKQDFTNLHDEYTMKKLAPGNYSVRVKATSLAGDGAFTAAQIFYIPEASHSTSTDVLLGVLVTFFFLLAIFSGLVYWRKKVNPSVPNIRLIPNINPEYVSANAVYIPDEWEVPRKSIEFIKELGQGSFGMVYEGIAHDIVEGEPRARCAVKTVNEVATDRERVEFLNEASVMKAFHTYHVVKLLGVVSEGQPTLVVMELMTNGDLKTYLRSHRPDQSDDPSIQPPTLKRILQMAVEIADGMAYLSAKKFVHRDLAARNCMVTDDLTVKIGDFGMTRDIYETDYYRKGRGSKGLLPVRWMAPESLKDGVFTCGSDVWSFGVVLWEMATLASQPYQGLTNDQVLRYVIEGGVMERPENCPDKLYELMQLCWQHRPSNRPHFIEFVTRLLPDAKEQFAKNSFYFSPEGHDLRAQLADAKEHATETDLNLQTSETPLRIARDIEDFSMGGSEDEEEEEADLDVDAPCVQTPKRGFFSPVLRPGTIYKPSILAVQDEPKRTKPVTLASVSSSDSSRGSKISNGSATTPTTTTVNGFIGRPSNGNSQQQTTQC